MDITLQDLWSKCGANQHPIQKQKSRKLLFLASCERLNDLKKYPEPEQNRLKERKEKEKK